MNKLDWWRKRKFWIGVLLGVAIVSITFISPKVTFVLEVPFFDYLIVGSAIAGFVAGRGIKDGIKAGLLVFAGLIIIEISFVLYDRVYLEFINDRIFYYEHYELNGELIVFAIPVVMAISGAIGGGIRKIINNKVFRWIIQQAKLLLERYEDNKFKDNEIAKFIKNHTLLLALIVIFIGILVIFFGDYNPSKGNTVLIDSQFGDRHERTVPYFVNVSMRFNYEEPVVVQMPLNFYGVCLDYTKNPLYNGSINTSITWIDVRVSTRVFPDLESPANYNIPIAYFERNLSEDSRTYRIRTNCYSYELASVIPINPSINPNLRAPDFYLEYILDYKVGDDWFIQSGRANLSSPIRVLDSVEEMNMHFNRAIISLTGVLIILGSLPFFAALKQLLNDEEKK